MGIRKAKKITTNAIVYCTISAVIAAIGLYKENMAYLGFAMWMIQMAHFFKKTKHKKKKSTDSEEETDIACSEVVDISGGCNVCT